MPSVDLSRALLIASLAGIAHLSGMAKALEPFGCYGA